MAPAAGGEAHFQRGSLPWFTAIALSFGYYTMVVTKSEAGRAASAYFRPARRLPALVTVLALGYLAVRRAAGRRVSFGPPGPRRPRGRLVRLRGGRLPRLPARAGGRWAPGAGVRSGRLASASPSCRPGRERAEFAGEEGRLSGLRGGMLGAGSWGLLGKRVGCLLASECPLSEPRTPGPLHSVLGGPSSHPLAQRVLACLADSCGRVLVCHGFVQV